MRLEEHHPTSAVHQVSPECARRQAEQADGPRRLEAESEDLSRRYGLARTAGSIPHGDVSGACWPKCVAKGRRGVDRRAVLEQPNLIPRAFGAGRRHRLLRVAGVRSVPTGRHWVFQSGGPAALGNFCGAHSAARTWGGRTPGLGRYHFGCTRSAKGCEASAVYTDGGPGGDRR